MKTTNKIKANKNEIPKQLFFVAERTERTDAKITGVAYSGSAIAQTWSGVPIIVDLEGMTIAAQTPLMYNHNYSPEYRLGRINVANNRKTLTFDGEIDTDTELGAGVVAQGKKYDWQASIGADTGKMKSIDEGESETVNGRTVEGPALIVRTSKLREVSLVALGADSDTHIRIAATLTKTKGEDMNKEKDNKATQVSTPEPVVTAAAVPDISAQVQQGIEEFKAAEKSRIEAISTTFGNDFPEIKAKAIAEGMTIEEANAALIKALRENKPAIPSFYISGEHANKSQALHAAALISAGVTEKEVIASTSEAAIESASKHYRAGVGPQRLILECALANGFTDSMIDSMNWHSALGFAVKAGFSTVSLTGILADVYNKRLLQGFNSADQSWREIAAIGNASDFKQTNSYRLNLLGGFDKVGPGGELKHAQLSDEAFSNQVETYGKMLGLTRQDIINDDLGALQKVPFQWGRAAMNSFNLVFWTEFMDNASFFTTGKGNKIETAAALSVAGLDAAETAFYAIKAADENVTGIKPAILLTPIGLKNLAKQLFTDTVLGVTALASTSKASKDPISNPHAGSFKPVASPYLSDALISGNSVKDYYLLADPQDCPVIEAAFLNGRQAPFVESSAAAFNTLGIQYRAYMDFGVKKQDDKGGLKMEVA